MFLGLNLVLASCALLAAIMASWSLRALRKKLAERPTRSLRELEAEIASHDATLSSISMTLRRLSSRYGMQAVRERQKQESEQIPLNLSPAERKARLRQGLSNGKLKIVRDGHQVPDE